MGESFALTLLLGHVLGRPDQPVLGLVVALDERPADDQDPGLAVGPDDAVLACKGGLGRDRIANDRRVGLAVVGVDQGSTLSTVGSKLSRLTPWIS